MRLESRDGMRSGLSCFFFQAEDGIRDLTVTGVQTCALPIYRAEPVENLDSGWNTNSHGGDREKAVGVGVHPHCEHVVCRSEERRVGKECRSRWSPYH